MTQLIFLHREVLWKSEAKQGLLSHIVAVCGTNDQFSLEELGGNVCKVFHPNGNFCLLHDCLDLFFTNSMHVVVV